MFQLKTTTDPHTAHGKSEVLRRQECWDGQIMTPSPVSKRLRSLFIDGDENVVAQFVRHNRCSLRHRADCRYSGSSVCFHSEYVTKTTALACAETWRTRPCRHTAPRHRKRPHSKATSSSFLLFRAQHIWGNTISPSIPPRSWSRRAFIAKQTATKAVAEATAPIGRCVLHAARSP